MGLSEVVKALILVKADTSQAKAEIKSLRGVEREAAQARLGEIEKSNNAVEASIKAWTKATVAVGAVAGAVVVAKKAWSAWAEDIRLGAAATGANIDRLAAATNKLVVEDDLLAFAGKAMHGVWKLNHEEMEVVLRGAMALRKTMGVDLKTAMDAVTESVTKGTTRGLKELGIEAKDKEEALRKLDEVAKSLGGNFELAGDDIARTGISMSNSFDSMVGSLGRIVNALAPVAEVLANITSSASKIVELFTSLNKIKGAWNGEMWGDDDFKDPLQTANENRQAGIRAAKAAAMDAEREKGRFEFQRGMDLRSRFEKATAADRKEKKHDFEFRGEDLGDEPIRYGDMLFSGLPELNEYLAKIERANELNDIASTFGSRNDQLDAMASKNSERRKKEEEKQAAYDKALLEASRRGDEALDRKKTEEDFSKLFGTTEGMDAQTVALEGMAGAFATLQDAAGDAYDTLIKGGELSMSSFKKVIASGIAAMGKDFFVRGLGELAHAAASFANPLTYAKGTQHLKAAGAYFVGAAVAGATANALGYGSGGGGSSASSSAGGSRAGNSLGSGSRGGDITRNVTVILGGGYDNMSERERNARFARAVKRGMAAGESKTIRDG